MARKVTPFNDAYQRYAQYQASQQSKQGNNTVTAGNGPYSNQYLQSRNAASGGTATGGTTSTPQWSKEAEGSTYSYNQSNKRTSSSSSNSFNADKINDLVSWSKKVRNADASSLGNLSKQAEDFQSYFTKNQDKYDARTLNTVSNLLKNGQTMLEMNGRQIQAQNTFSRLPASTSVPSAEERNARQTRQSIATSIAAGSADLSQYDNSQLEQLKKLMDEETEAKNKDTIRNVSQYSDPSVKYQMALMGSMNRNSEIASSDIQKQIDSNNLDAEELRRYGQYRNRDDFAEKSKYISTRREAEPTSAGDYLQNVALTSAQGMAPTRNDFDTARKYGDVQYEARNQNTEAQRLYTNTFGEDTDRATWMMNDDERGIYNYLYNTEGRDSAEEYLNLIGSRLNKRQMDEFKAANAEMAQNDPVGASLYSVIRGPERMISAIGQVADYAGDRHIDENAWYNRYSTRGTAIRNDVQQQIDAAIGDNPVLSTLGNFGYQTGMSMADFVWTAAMTGAFSGASGAAASLAENASLVLMSSGAMADSVIQAKESGMDDDRAFTLGVLSGLAEYATEKVSLDTLLRSVGNGRAWYVNLLNNMLAEGSEEIASDFINNTGEMIYDVLSSQDEATWKRQTAKYMDQGMSEGEAFGHAINDQLKQMGMSGLGGALSGAGMGGGVSAFNGITNLNNNVRTVNNLDQEGINALIEEGLASPTNTKAYQNATRLAEQAERGEDIGKLQLLNQIYKNQAQIDQEDADTYAGKLITEAADVVRSGETVDNNLVNEILASPEARGILQDNSDMVFIQSRSDARKALKQYVDRQAQEAETTEEAAPQLVDNAVEEMADEGGLTETTAKKLLKNKAVVEQLEEQTGETIKNIDDINRAMWMIVEPETYGPEARQAAQNQQREEIPAQTETSAPAVQTRRQSVPANVNRELLNTNKTEEQANNDWDLIENLSNRFYENGLNELSASVVEFYDDDFNAVKYNQAFNEISMAGLQGQAIPETILPLNIASEIYDTARKEGLSRYGRGETVRIPGDTGRVLSENTDGQSRGVGSSTAAAYRGTGTAQQTAVVRGDTFQLSEQQVTAKDLGIRGGTAQTSVRLVTGGLTEEMSRIQKVAANRGIDLQYFVGDNLSLNDKADSRGLVYTDNRGRTHIYARADHPVFSGDQIALHELYHDGINREASRTGRSRNQVINDRYRQMAKHFKGDFVESFVLPTYMKLYEGSGLTMNEIKEELLCDMAGGLNEFSKIDGLMNIPALRIGVQSLMNVRMQQFENEIATEQTGEEANETRGPPQVFESKDIETENVIDLSDDTALHSRLTGLNNTERQTAIRDYILEVLSEQPVTLTDGTHAIVDKRDAKHVAHGALDEKTAEIAKIKKLVETAALYATDNNAIHPKFDSFKYYRAFVKYDNTTYPVYLNVGHGKYDREYHIYDITHYIKDTAVMERARSLRSDSSASNDYISQPNENGNTEFTGKQSIDNLKIPETALTMKQAEDMIQRAFVLGDINNWYDGQYRNGVEWLKGQGVEDVALIIDNEYRLQEKYINPNIHEVDGESFGWGEDYLTEDVLQAYLDGTLIGHSKAKASRLDLSQNVRINDQRFYAPQQIDNAKELLSVASQRMTNANRAEVINARAQLVIFAHNEGAAELLGMTKAEFNKRIRNWTGYSARAIDTSTRLNKGVAASNRWTGIENSSWAYKATVTDEQIESLVNEIQGKADSYEKQIIARTMLAIDTHTDWSWLNVEFVSGKIVHNNSNVRGLYTNSERQIQVGYYMPNTVAHEMGHALDYKWARDFRGENYSNSLTDAIGISSFENQLNDEQKAFVNNFRAFMDSLTDNGDIRSEYAQDPKETFARFVDRFVRWTNSVATGQDVRHEFGDYSDNFTTAQFSEFVKLLQEKALLDSKASETVQQSRDIQFTGSLSEDLQNLANAYADLEAQYNEVQAENRQNRNRAEYFKGETRLGVYAENPKGVEKIAKNFIKEYNLKTNEADLTKKLQKYAKDFWSGQKDFMQLADDVLPLANEIVRSARELVESPEKEMTDRIRKTKIRVSDKIKSDIPNYGSWRSQYMGRMNISTLDGMPVEDFYREMQDSYGMELFPDDIGNPTDQLQHIADIVDSLAPYRMERMFDSYSMAEATQDVAFEIIQEITGMHKTYADKQRDRMNRMRTEMQAKAKADIQAVRKQRDNKIQQMKDHFREVRQNERIRKAESFDRSKLLKVMKRLDNISKKAGTANRALIQELIGDYDLVAKTITDGKVEKLQDLSDYIEKMMEIDPNFMPTERAMKDIARLGKKHIADMDINEARMLTEALLHLEHEIQTHNKLIDTQYNQDITTLGNQIYEGVMSTKGIGNSKIGVFNWFQQAYDKAIATPVIRPETEILRLVGFDRNNPLYQLTFGTQYSLASGQRDMVRYQWQANKKYFDKFLNDRAFITEIMGKKARECKITGKTSSGKALTLSVTPDLLMALYMHSQNDQNFRHFGEWMDESGKIQHGDGVTIPDFKTYRKGNLKEAYRIAARDGNKITMTKKQLSVAMAQLTQKEKAFIQAAQKYYSEMSQTEINRISERLLGYGLAQVDNYFRINTDSDYRGTNMDAIKMDGTIEGMGFTKERTNACNAILLISLSEQLRQDIDSHSKYVGLAIPVRNFNKAFGVNRASVDAEGNWLGSEGSVQAAIHGRWGTGAEDYIQKLMSDIQNPVSVKDGWKGILGKMRSFYAGSVLAMNFGVAMKQAASYPTAAAVVGWKPLIKAFGNSSVIKANRLDMNIVNQYSPLMYLRTQGMGYQELADLKNLSKGWLNRALNSKALNWIQDIDVLTIKKLWKAAEYYVRDNFKDLKVGSEEYYRKVGEIHSEIIEETQPNYTTLQRGEILRSDSDIVRTLLGMFKTQPFQNASILFEGAGELQAACRAYKANPNEETKLARTMAVKKLSRAITSQLVASLVFALMQGAWDWIRGKDDKYRDKEGNLTVGSFMKQMAINMGSNGFGMLPLGSVLYETIETCVDTIAVSNGGDKIFDQMAYGLDGGAATGIINDMQSAITKITDLTSSFGSEEKPNAETSIRTLVDVGSTLMQAAGYPAGNFVKDVQAVGVNMFRGMDAAGAMSEYEAEYYTKRMMGPVSSKTKGDYMDLLYRAYDNDKAAYNKLYNSYIENDGFATSSKSSKEYIDEKIEKHQKEADQLKARQSAGITENIAANYQNALDQHDYNHNGSYTQEEVYDALMSISLSMSQRETLWAENGWKKSFSDYKNGGSSSKSSGSSSSSSSSSGSSYSSRTQTTDMSSSGMIQDVSYDPTSEELKITFRSSGKTYTYHNISKDTWYGFKYAQSKDDYFNDHIKRK